MNQCFIYDNIAIVKENIPYYKPVTEEKQLVGLVKGNTKLQLARYK